MDNPPTLNIPSSSATAQVRIVDTTSTIDCPADAFMLPRIGGLDRLIVNAWAFIVEGPEIPGANGKRRKIMFDLGVRKDWENLATPLVEGLKKRGFRVSVEKDVATLLKEAGERLEDFEAIIWRYSSIISSTPSLSSFPRCSASY
jgi:hypothetical protein